MDGAEFQIQRGDKYPKLDTTTGEWSEAADQASATTFTTGDSNNDGKVDHKDNAAQKGLIAFQGSGYGNYTVTETKGARRLYLPMHEAELHRHHRRCRHRHQGSPARISRA